jgi:hypothetical protein
MQNLGLVLLCFAFVFAVIAACFNPPVPSGRWHFGWLAVAFLIAAEIFAGAGRAFFFH